MCFYTYTLFFSLPKAIPKLSIQIVLNLYTLFQKNFLVVYEQIERIIV
jgi:hypothetical protein